MKSTENIFADVPLTSLKPRQCGVVAVVEAPDSDLERLMAMGVCGGRTVELVQVGDPLIVKVYGTRVGVSARLAERIRVTPCRTVCQAEGTVCPVIEGRA
jgi:Fe2+ transport system protein FeoA